jgi:uncharacterized membrane protein YqjE
MPMDDSDSPARTTGGLLDSVRALMVTLVAMAHTRVELFGTEIEQEVHRIVTLVIGGMAVLAFAGLALLFTALVVIATFWDTHRIAATACVAAGFVALALVSYAVLRARTQRTSRLLSSTLDELERDLRQLGRRSSP